MESVESKIDKILEELEFIKNNIDLNNTLHLQTSLEQLYKAVNPAIKTPNLVVFKELPDMIFNAVSKRKTRGLILQTSLATTEDMEQHWYMSNAFYEDLNEIEDYTELENQIQIISSKYRIQILHLIFKGKHRFKEFKGLGIADASLDHHLKYLVKYKAVKKKDRMYFLNSYGTHLLFFALGLKKLKIE